MKSEILDILLFGDKLGAVVNLFLMKGARFMFSNFASVVVQVQAWARLPF
jgi:hypothetical protein